MFEESRNAEKSKRQNGGRALLAKEWFEHRWRFALGTIFLSTLLGGMLRAQVVPFHEAAITIFWPVGTIMAIFLAMGPIAMEKTGRTWEFLLAQPVPKSRILLAKWRMGLYELIGMTFVAGLSGILAMWSRGFYGRSTIWQWTQEDDASVRNWTQLIGEHPALWLILLVIVATASLCSWYTFLFFMLIRARNEFEAALGGLLLTLAAHAWLGQVQYAGALGWIAGLNPFSVFIVLIQPKFLSWLPWMIAVHSILWILLPVLIIQRMDRRQSHV